MKMLALILSTLLLAACGGGGGSSSPSVATSPTSSTPPEQLALMVDSLGRTVAETDFGGGDSGAAGADGSAGDGKPIPNASVTLRDNAGHTATATTDSLGYYRVSVKGFTPPFIAKVVRADGSAWYSPSITPVKVRGFVTVNLTGLTDKLASDVATAAGVSGGAAQLTTTTLAANTTALQTAKTNLNALLAEKITVAGLNPATFDPVTTPFKAVPTDSSDKILESVVIVKDISGVTAVATAPEGNWVRTAQATNYIRNGVAQPDYSGLVTTLAAANIGFGERNFLVKAPTFTANRIVANGLTENCSLVSVTSMTSYTATCTYTDSTSNYSVNQIHNYISFVGCGACAVGSTMVRVQTEAVTSVPGGTFKGAPLVSFSDSLTWTYTYTRIN